MRRVIALRHTEATPDGSLAVGAERFIAAMVPKVAAIGLTFGKVLVSTSARARRTAELLLKGLNLAAPIEEHAIFDPPPDEAKKGVPGTAEIVAGIKAYRALHPDAGVATAILASPGGEEYMRRKAAAILNLIGGSVGDILIVAHENGVASLAIEAVGQGYDTDIISPDFRFVEGVCITLNDDGEPAWFTELRNPIFKS